MTKQLLFFILVFLFGVLQAQDLERYDAMKAEFKGGQENFEQVIQTQLSFPKNFFSNGYEENVTIYFLLDSANQPGKAVFRPHIVPAGQKELLRILRFLQFTKQSTDPNQPYFVTVPVAFKHYFSLTKQRQKTIVKLSIPADSSYKVFPKADRSPEYFKGGEIGLKDYILTEIEYPKLALEKSVEGTVVVEFIVETNGYVTGVSIKQALGAGCSEEAIRLIKKTRWQPAMINGKLVRYKLTYPITFSIRNVSKTSNFDN